MPTITSEYLDKFRTDRGAWTLAQMKAIGVPWPQPSGWRLKVCGKQITDEQAVAFESGRTKFKGKTVRLNAAKQIVALEFAGQPVPDELRKVAQPVANTPPTNPKSIRRAERKAKKKANRFAKMEQARQAQAASVVKPWWESGWIAATKPSPKPAAKTPARMKPAPVHKKPAPTMVGGVCVTTDAFLSTYEWRRVRMTALKKYGAVCQCCGASPATGAVMNVDHIKPRKLFPQLALDVDNLQVLCHECDHGKGNWDMTDWRPAEVSDLDAEALAHMRAIAHE